VWRDNRGQDMRAVQVATESTKPIRGYLVINSFLDPITGTVTRRISIKVLERQGNPSEDLAPGSAWVVTSRKFSHLPGGALASYKLSLDLIVLATARYLLQKRSGESAEVLGMFHGIDAQIT
jgi:hypothetical protein